MKTDKNINVIKTPRVSEAEGMLNYLLGNHAETHADHIRKIQQRLKSAGLWTITTQAGPVDCPEEMQWIIKAFDWEDVTRKATEIELDGAYVVAIERS